jgi:hypothetical protein
MIRPERQEEMKECIDGILLEFSMASYTLEECDAIVNILAQELKNIRQAISNQAVFPSTKQPEAKEEVKEAKPVQEKKVKNG